MEIKKILIMVMSLIFIFTITPVFAALNIDSNSITSDGALTLTPSTNVLINNGSLGIGTTDPQWPLHIVGTVAAIYRYNGVPQWTMFRANGTPSNPTALTSTNSNVGELGAYAYDGTAYRNTAYIRFTSDAIPIAGTSLPGDIEFWTTPVGTITSVQRMRIDGSGNVGIGTTMPTGILSVTPSQYSTGTASQSGTTVTGVGTAFTSDMVGSELTFNIISSATSAGTILAVIDGTHLTVSTSQNVPSQKFNIASPGLQVTSTGVGLGTKTPTSKLQVVGLPVYANNAAAIAGGLTTGAFYRTGADPDPVMVVH